MFPMHYWSPRPPASRRNLGWRRDGFPLVQGNGACLARRCKGSASQMARRMKRSRRRPLPSETMTSLRINPVRRVSITSVLLILALIASSSSCVVGWCSQRTASCSHSIALKSCARKNHDVAEAMGADCGSVLEPSPGTCRIRGFVQPKFAAFQGVEISIPLRCVAGRVSAPSDFPILVSSVGSPETDRGPPRS
jgi:hypothetical protein